MNVLDPEKLGGAIAAPVVQHLRAMLDQIIEKPIRFDVDLTMETKPGGTRYAGSVVVHVGGVQR